MLHAGLKALGKTARVAPRRICRQKRRGNLRHLGTSCGFDVASGHRCGSTHAGRGHGQGLAPEAAARIEAFDLQNRRLFQRTCMKCHL